MYCSGCGKRIEEGLNYCSRCGKRVAESDLGTAAIAESHSSSLGYVGSAGFISYIFVLLVLVKNGVSPSYLVPISFFYFAALFGICFLILRQTQLFTNKEKPPREIRGEAPAAYLHAVTTGRLQEPGDPGIGSITEHTTRTLEEVPLERR